MRPASVFAGQRFPVSASPTDFHSSAHSTVCCLRNDSPLKDEPTRIVGIVLVRNEDFFVGQAVRNVAAFCDTLLLCDHKSSDRTASILRELAAELPDTSFHAVEHPRESHEFLKPFAGTRTWVFRGRWR